MQILAEIKKIFIHTLYVQIWEKRIKVTDIDSGKVYDQAPMVAIETSEKGAKIICATGNAAASKIGPNIQVVNPFSHPRVLFADFTVGEKLLQAIFREIHPSSLMPSFTTVVIHPMEKIEGGLTQIEVRAFLELAMNAGARKAAVHEGPELPRHGFESALGRHQVVTHMGSQPSKTVSKLEAIIYVAVAILVFGYAILKG